MHPLEKLTWQRVGRAAPGAPGGRSTRPGFLGSNSHGYREIFTSSRWATVAGRAATLRKPSHPRDKDRPVTYLDLGSGRPPRGWDWGGGRRLRAALHPPGMPAEDEDN